jgi:hypothetical protein
MVELATFCTCSILLTVSLSDPIKRKQIQICKRQSYKLTFFNAKLNLNLKSLCEALMTKKHEDEFIMLTGLLLRDVAEISTSRRHCATCIDGFSSRVGKGGRGFNSSLE